MANQIEVKWVTPQNPNFFEDLFTGKPLKQSDIVIEGKNDHNCNSARDSDSLEIDQLDTGLMSQMFQKSFLSIVADTCDSVASKVKKIRDSKDEPTPDDLRSLEHLELEVRDSLTSIRNGFFLLMHMDTRCTNALRSLKYNQSVIKDVPNEVWTRIFVLAIAPFGAIVHDDRGYLDLSTDNMSLTGTEHCCPETLMLVCGQWYDIAIHTPGLWRNISKAHVAPPSPVSSALTDDTIRKLARKPVTKRLLSRLLRHSMSKDRLAHRALAYAERSGNGSPLFVDLRCTTFPAVIMDVLRPHFSRINVLYIDKWDRDVINYLSTFKLIKDGGPHQTTDFLFPNLTTLSFTTSSDASPIPQLGTTADRCEFPRLFKEAPNLINLKIGFQFDLVSSSFYDVPWKQLEVLEIDRVLDCTDILWILKECSSLKDAIISCPSVEWRDPFLSSHLRGTDIVQLPNLQSLHYQCETDFDVDLMLLQYLDMPKLRVLSLHADVDPVIGSWLESPRAEELVMRRMFSGAWPLFSTLELLHYDTSDEQELLAIKTSMEHFAASNYPRGTSAGRKIYICGHGVTEEQEDRFHLCVTDGVGDETRLKFAVQRIDNWV